MGSARLRLRPAVQLLQAVIGRSRYLKRRRRFAHGWGAAHALSRMKKTSKVL